MNLAIDYVEGATSCLCKVMTALKLQELLPYIHIDPVMSCMISLLFFLTKVRNFSTLAVTLKLQELFILFLYRLPNSFSELHDKLVFGTKV